MKILHVLKHCHDGNGHVHVAVDLACVQAATGQEVVFASAGGFYETLLAAHGVEHVTIPHPGGVLGTAGTARALLALTRRLRPDVMHAHMMTSAVLGWVVSKLTGVPLITTMHNSFDRHSVLMRLGKVVVAVSEAERNLLLSRGYPGAQVVTVLNGANGSPRAGLGTHPQTDVSRPCVMTVAGLHKRKGVADVIAAFAEVRPEFPDWHLNIVGNGPDRVSLGELAGRLGIAGSVHFLGSSFNPQSLLEQADIFASASLAEPFGLAVAEARAAGCAVVATAVGGVPEVLDQGRAGQLTPVSNPPAMAAVFRKLMGHEEELRAWRARAAMGVEHFTVQRMARDYLQVYASVIA